MASILTVNTGSSSLKAALYGASPQGLSLELSMLAERIGQPDAAFHIRDAQGRLISSASAALPDHSAALAAVLGEPRADNLDGVGHRVVHGGSRYSAPERVSASLLQALRELVPIDPMHLPQAISTIELVGRLRPELPQVACFDTAFHRSMPRLAQIYPLPRHLAEQGIIRYGFHGLSYEYIVERLRELDIAPAGRRVIAAHLGNGASMAAIRDGRSVDTTMGFTPTGGLMMGTRSGDLDPGVLLHLASEKGMTAEDIRNLVNTRSGLLGVSGRGSDMRELLQAAPADAAAAEAVELFCYLARKFVCALAAVLGGLDTLVFTGGIGEHAAPVRQRICAGLEFLGILLDHAANEAGAEIISSDGASVTVRVIPTDEELMIARHTDHLLRA